jgi:hypothetical protein
MLNRRHTTPERTFPRMVAALALLGLGAVWLRTRARPDRTGQGNTPRPSAAPATSNPTEPLWASVAGEEDPGAAVEPPSVATPHDGRE